MSQLNVVANPIAAPHAPVRDPDKDAGGFKDAVARSRGDDSALVRKATTATPARAETAARRDGEAPISENRRQDIASWFAEKRDSGPFGLFDRVVNADDVTAALRGDSRLGALTSSEQRLIADISLNRWAPAGAAGRSFSGAMELNGIARGLAADGSAATRDIVAERFMARADTLLMRPNPGNEDHFGPHMRGGSLAMTALALAPDSAARSRLIAGMSEQAAAAAIGARTRLMIAFDPARQLLPSALEGLAAGPMNAAGQAFVESAFAKTDRAAYQATPELGQSMGRALARVWYPRDAALRTSEGERFAGILRTGQGLDLIADQRVPAPARLQALTVLRDNPGLTAQVLSAHRGSGWDNPTVTQAMARPMAEQFLTLRGNAALELRGTHLDNTVGMAMGLPIHGVPANETPAQTEAREAAFTRGAHSYYAQGPNVDAVRNVVEEIRSVGGEGHRVAVLPIQYTNAQTGAVTVPLFRVERADGGVRFVDNTGRSYRDFQDWRNNNTLPEGTMVFPENGLLTRGTDNEIRLQSAATPKTPDTLWEHFSGALDTVALVGGIVAGGAILLGSGGMAAPLVLGGAGLWQAGRTGMELYDRTSHGESANPFTDRAALTLWVDLGASALSAGAAGNAFRLVRAARTGGAISPLGATATAALNVSANAADAGAMLNTGHLLLTNWNQLTPSQRAQMGLSMAFWGVSSAATTRLASGRTASDFVNTTFNPSLMRQQLLDTYRPPVLRDGQLPGNAVRIEYTEARGVVTGVRIRAGESAAQADISLHAGVAQSMMRHAGLEGRLRNLFAARGEPPVGSRAWEAQREVNKLGRVIEHNRRLLDNPAFLATEREQIRADIASYQTQLDSYQACIAQFENGLDPSARGGTQYAGQDIFARQGTDGPAGRDLRPTEAIRGAWARYGVVQAYQGTPPRTDGRGVGQASEGLGGITKTVYRARPEVTAIWSQGKISAPDFLELKPGNANVFHQSISAAKQGHYSAAVTLYSPQEYANMRLFLTPDGKAGFALKGDDIASVFRHPDSTIKNIMPSMLDLAVSQGGRRLDAFDTVLPDLYSRAGFRAVSRTPFDPEHKPAGWSYDEFKNFNGGKPVVVFMVFDPAHGKPYQTGDGITARDYDAAAAIQRSALRQIEGNWAHGLGHIDAESAGRIRAQELGLPERPISPERAGELGLTAAQAESYHWYLPPGLDAPVVRSALENRPRFAWDSQAGSTVRVPGDPVLPSYVHPEAAVFNSHGTPDARLDAALAVRSRLIQERNTLLELRERGVVLTADQNAALSRLHGAISEHSRIIGEIGAQRYVQSQFPDAQLVHGGPDRASQSGDFDQIWRVPGPDGDRFIVIEAKGGSSALGTRRVGVEMETQGTKKYFEAIVEQMGELGNPNVRALADEVRSAQERGDLTYLEVRSPIVNGRADQVRVREFDLAR